MWEDYTGFFLKKKAGYLGHVGDQIADQGASVDVELLKVHKSRVAVGSTHFTFHSG